MLMTVRCHCVYIHVIYVLYSSIFCSFLFLLCIETGSMLVKNTKYKHVKFFVQTVKKIDYLAVMTVIIVLNGYAIPYGTKVT
jgi:hypothetical protein